MNPIILEAARQLRKELDLAWPGRILQVVVFGSMARNEEGPDSDLDLLVVIDRLESELRTAVYDTAHDISAARNLPWWISPTVITRERLDDLLAHERLFAQDILREGVCL